MYENDLYLLKMQKQTKNELST